MSSPLLLKAQSPCPQYRSHGEYNDLQEVFSKEKPTKLPPHRPWECAIDLLPNTMPPKSHIYPLSPSEKKAMKTYIEEALAAGYIWPATSPAAAGFFFIEKKDGGLWLCIDYHGLNSITVQYPYPLPLVPNISSRYIDLLYQPH